jgi:hypothetical protein
MMKDTFLFIDDHGTDTHFSRSRQQGREPLVALLMVTKQDAADKFKSEYKNKIPMKTKSTVCVYAHAKQV